MNRLHAAWHWLIGHRQHEWHPSAVFGWHPLTMIVTCSCGRRWEW